MSKECILAYSFRRIKSFMREKTGQQEEGCFYFIPTEEVDSKYEKGH